MLQGDAPHLPGITLSTSSTSSDTLSHLKVPAADQCWISASGGLEGLIGRRQPGPFTCVAELSFNDGLLTLDALLLMAHVVSRSSPNYDLLNTQCYWFASRLWGLIKHVTATTDTITYSTWVAGSHSFVPFLLLAPPPTAAECEALAEKYMICQQKYMEQVLRVKLLFQS